MTNTTYTPSTEARRLFGNMRDGDDALDLAYDYDKGGDYDAPYVPTYGPPLPCPGTLPMMACPCHACRDARAVKFGWAR